MLQLDQRRLPEAETQPEKMYQELFPEIKEHFVPIVGRCQCKSTYITIKNNMATQESGVITARPEHANLEANKQTKKQLESRCMKMIEYLTII